MGTPDGGPYDETPPRIVRTSPKFGGVNSKATKVVIEFDELIKIENAQEKVVISPPQIEMPEIETSGRKITVTLQDSLKPDYTYTIDFADAIVDNNEGNPFGDYAFTFSTGERIDTMQVSGHVLNAEDLEPIKGMLVGLYKVGDIDSDSADIDLPDSTFRTRPFERISRTDSRGHFVIKGLANGRYRVFALDDKNQNFIYDQRAEKIAFSDRVIETSCAPDVRNDTVWHDSIHYDSIVRVRYTHFYPDDITLLAFQTAKQDQHLLKSERLEPKMFSLYFTAPADSLPRLTGLNFEADSAFIIDASQHNDTINYWIRDSLVYNLDTLDIKIDFLATDTAGALVPTTDTLNLASKLTREKIEKQEKDKWEKWAKEFKQKVKREKKAMNEKVNLDTIAVPPLPEEFMTYKTGNASSLAPDQNILFEFTEPLDSIDMSKLHFSVKVDTVFVPAKFLFRQVEGQIKNYCLYAEWEPDSTYKFDVDTAAFVNIYGKRNAAASTNIKVRNLDDYSTLFVKLQNPGVNPVVQLLDGTGKVVKTVKAEDGKADFYFVNPGTMYMRMFCDLNDNGIWDTGEYDDKLLPEPVYYYPSALQLKAKWEVSQDWSPLATPLVKQKPDKITKQKPDKEKKSAKSRNEERLREKREGKKTD